MHLQESTLFDLDLQVKVTLNVAQCPLHHVTYAHTEFEVTMSKALGGSGWGVWCSLFIKNLANYSSH